MPETQRIVVRNALNGLFTKGHFDICTVRALCKVVDVSENTPAFRMLHGEALRPPVTTSATTAALAAMERSQ